MTWNFELLADHVGETFTATLDDETSFDLVLTEAEPAGAGGSLSFVTDVETAVTQGTVAMSHPDLDADFVFIVRTGMHDFQAVYG